MYDRMADINPKNNFCYELLIKLQSRVIIDCLLASLNAPGEVSRYSFANWAERPGFHSCQEK
jgi:hypothetical protein